MKKEIIYAEILANSFTYCSPEQEIWDSLSYVQQFFKNFKKESSCIFLAYLKHVQRREVKQNALQLLSEQQTCCQQSNDSLIGPTHPHEEDSGATDPVSKQLNDVSKLSKSLVAYQEKNFPPKSSSWAHWVVCLDWLGAVNEGTETMQSMNSVIFVSLCAKNKLGFENTFCMKMSCENIHRSISSNSISKIKGIVSKLQKQSRKQECRPWKQQRLCVVSCNTLFFRILLYRENMMKPGIRRA